MQPCDLLITARALLPQDDERSLINQAAVAVTDGLVAGIGRMDEMEAAYAPDKRLDLGRALLLPGLVNAHCHAAMSVFRGLADDLPLMDWLRNNIWPVEKRLSKEMVHLGSLLSCVEMLRRGITCFSDMYLHEHQVTRAADESGIRCLAAEGVIQTPTLTYDSPEEGYRLIRELHAQYARHPRVGTAVMAHAVYTTGPSMLQESYKLAEELDTPWMIHAAESTTETASCVEAHGDRPLPYLDSLGLLTPRATLFHCVDVTEGEIELLADRGVAVVHCPQSNMKLGNGLAPVEAMRRAGVRLALGTDGAASNNDLNLFSEMASAAHAQKALTGDPASMPAQAVLDMATLGGADALGLPGLGRLEEGESADLIALDLDKPNLVPLHNPASQAVYATSGAEVLLTMVEGEALYLDGHMDRVDLDALRREVESARKWVQRQLAS
ncbi:amidohydrolase [Desulfohalovibrio reitneri]|uniref:amidohydrolase n=1 Tax=Desulfohalovibrio reitneri TaxID=1307759 RepID=UPI0004A6FD4F|nr:amidohydrolase [Desulfohalovibrio reitneri]